MTLPVTPEVETVLQSCIETIRDVVLPEVSSDWGRYSAELCVASLQYASGLLAEDRDTARREQLAAAVESLRAECEAAEDASPGRAWGDAFAADSPFEIASSLLVTSQDRPGALADRVQETLHPLLIGQLDHEMAAGMPLFIAFARNMTGR